MSFGTCKRCGATVYWLKCVSTGRVAPIDAEPAHEPRSGNILIDLHAGSYRVVAAAPGLFVNHFSTCAAAKEFRRARPPAPMPAGRERRRR